MPQAGVFEVDVGAFIAGMMIVAVPMTFIVSVPPLPLPPWPSPLPCPWPLP